LNQTWEVSASKMGLTILRNQGHPMRIQGIRWGMTVTLSCSMFPKARVEIARFSPFFRGFAKDF